ncbi:MAG: CBS domain-containing protein [Bacteroidales bacterium]
MSTINIKKFGLAFGITGALLYLGCMFLMFTVGREGTMHFVNSNEKSYLVMEKYNVVGILSYKDIVEGLHKGKVNQKIRDFMQKDFYWFEEEEALSNKFFLLQQNRQSLFPVRKNGKLAGIVGIDDIHKWIQGKAFVFNH